jgi:hypothetical protein
MAAIINATLNIKTPSGPTETASTGAIMVVSSLRPARLTSASP